MNKAKYFGLVSLLALGTLVGTLLPAKASAQLYSSGIDYSTMNYGSRYSRYDDLYRMRFFRDGNFFRLRNLVTYPRTVYLVDAGNSANQLNIINATRGGTTTAAYITVPTWAYNRVVDAYNELGVVSVRVDRLSGVVTFMTVNGTFSVRAVNIDFI